MNKGTSVCIECGGPADSLNKDEHGSACPACAERLLETLPGVFHAPWGQEVEAHGVEGVDHEVEPQDTADEEPAGGPRPSSPGGRRSPGSTPRGDSFGDSFGEPRGSA